MNNTDDTDTDTDINIWYDDIDLANIHNDDNECDNDHEYNDECDNENDSEKDEIRENTSIPEYLLNYYLSSDRELRQQHFRSMSLKHKHYCYKRILSDTRRNLNRHKTITPKRGRKKRLNKRKTKKIMILTS